jgi:subtilisin family serine protease
MMMAMVVIISEDGILSIMTMLMNDNMHGTRSRVEGAVGGNNLGIAGAVWNVKLMPLKVFQSNGQGNASTIALTIIRQQ